MDPYPYLGLALWALVIGLGVGAVVGLFFLGKWILKLMGWL